jgi:23S rRNA pseudouridine2605 synthase
VQKKAKTGLARALSKLGYCSRSQAKELVRTGHVTLNGRHVLDPETPVHLEHDQVAVDHAPIEARPKLYLVMNKPRGLVTTASDEGGRATVYDLLKSTTADATDWVGPVGRLDKASEGLLLFTNDSTWAAQITDPDNHLEKRYHVQIDCVAGDDLLVRIKRGVHDGSERLSVKAAQIVRTGHKNSWLEIALEEGKNRQIRRLLEGLRVQVLRLVRVSIGPLELGDLKKGTVRPLTDEEKRLLDEALRAGTL